MNKYINEMKTIPLINTFSKEEIEEYLNKGYFKIKKFLKNSLIHMDEEKCTKIEVILSGNVIVDRIDYSGNLFTITNLGPGDVLGANLLFSKNPYYPMTVTATVETLIIEIEKEFLLELLWTNKEFLKSYLEFSSTNTVILTNKLKNSVNKTIRENIVNFLKRKYMLTNSLTIELNITKKQLAESFGINRTSLSRELKKMKEENLIEYDNKSIKIVDKDIINTQK